MTERLAVERDLADVYRDFRGLTDEYRVPAVDAARRVGTTPEAMAAYVKAEVRREQRHAASRRHAS